MKILVIRPFRPYSTYTLNSVNNFKLTNKLVLSQNQSKIFRRDMSFSQYENTVSNNLLKIIYSNDKLVNKTFNLGFINI